MQNKKLKWCFSLKDGLRTVEPNERLAKSYLSEAKASLERAEKNLKDGDLLWATVVIYYAEYYALYSFLQKIGIKCENHLCSITAAGILLGTDKTKTIDDHKNKRIDAQYYMKVDKGEEIEKMLQEAKLFISNFDELVSNLRQEEIKVYREKLKESA
ncbi:MAG: HEPN domain-containing protein [Candidatus Nanoarchaeia archaeon]|nr:HEPN domain-containing protein [Candidatus Nanoarchaeia archaeon]